jgi:hypothetical protein
MSNKTKCIQEPRKKKRILSSKIVRSRGLKQRECEEKYDDGENAKGSGIDAYDGERGRYGHEIQREKKNNGLAINVERRRRKGKCSTFAGIAR